MADPRCSDCGASLQVQEAAVTKGEIIICPECGVELEVVVPRPLKLRVLPDDES